MNRKNVFKRLLFPHPAVVIVLALVSVAGLAYSFIRLQPTDAVSIISYVVSFYSLTLICVRIPELIEMLQCFKQENRYYLRYSTDIRLKMNIHLYGGLVFNAAYAVFQLVLGLWHASVWFYAMALYYLLLAGMRFLLVQHTRSYANHGRMEEIPPVRCFAAGDEPCTDRYADLFRVEHTRIPAS